MGILRIVVLALLAQAGTQAAGSIQGVVMRAGSAGSAGSNDALSKTIVELRSVEGSTAETYTVTTASDGKFAFQNLQSGKYRLTATRANYVPMEYPTTIVIAGGRNVIDIRLAMTQTGSIY